MFDDLKKESVGNEPADIFAETDKVAPQVPAPTAETQQAAPIAANEASKPEPPPVTATPEEPVTPAVPTGNKIEERITQVGLANGAPWKAIIIVVAIIVIIGGAFFISMRILGSQTPTTPEPPTSLSPTSQVPAIGSEPVEEGVVEESEQVVDVDTDSDGLSDATEVKIGTSPKSPDTDGDGLFDREEVEVYKTNPLNPDTDGDTYLDGAEVKAGYNPNGEGVLLELPSVTE